MGEDCGGGARRPRGGMAELLGPERGVEARAVPRPRSLADLKRGISEKKWVEARQWAGVRTSKTKYRVPKSQRPGGTAAGSTERLASRFCRV